VTGFESDSVPTFSHNFDANCVPIATWRRHKSQLIAPLPHRLTPDNLGGSLLPLRVAHLGSSEFHSVFQGDGFEMLKPSSQSPVTMTQDLEFRVGRLRDGIGERHSDIHPILSSTANHCPACKYETIVLQNRENHEVLAPRHRDVEIAIASAAGV
jgi:hypothetical protein